MAEIDILREMNSGFSALYQKIDDKFEAIRGDFQEHLGPCQTRFSDIEKDLAIKRATNCAQKKGRDFWIYIIRGCILSISLGALVVIWNLLIGNFIMVVK